MQVEYLKNLVRIDRTLSYNFFLYGKERILTHFESVKINILPRFFRFVKNETASNKLGNMLNLTKKTLNQFFSSNFNTSLSVTLSSAVSSEHNRGLEGFCFICSREL